MGWRRGKVKGKKLKCGRQKADEIAGLRDYRTADHGISDQSSVISGPRFHIRSVPIHHKGYLDALVEAPLAAPIDPYLLDPKPHIKGVGSRSGIDANNGLAVPRRHCPHGRDGANRVKTRTGHEKDNMGWSGWEEFGNLTTDDKTNLRTKK